MTPFRVDIPDETVKDLHRRIASTRWPDEIPGAGWSRGVPVGYLQELATYWRKEFNWRDAERRLNEHPQFVTRIDGAPVHFLHVRSPEPDATALLLTHGWPGSVAEFLKVIGPLSDPRRFGGDPADAFHLVIPSLPGYGFSGPTGESGWDTRRVGRAWAELMSRLNYSSYIAQGGDWGMPISLQLALSDPSHVRGVHLNMFVTFPPPDASFDDLDDADRARLAFGAEFAQDGMGWQRIQSTRPQTLAYGLTDSPAGQLAWIVEKFREWTDSEKFPEDAVDRDLLLTNASIYWFTRTAGSSAQIYYESSHGDEAFARTWAGPWPVSAPVAVASFPRDAVRPVRRFAENLLPTLTQWTEFERGGHFAAMEQPAALVADIRRFARSLA